jgi:acyl carrier protein
MPEPTTLEQLTTIAEDVLGVDQSQVTEEAKWGDDLGADSLDAVELLVAFEQQFDIDISEEESAKCATVGDTIEMIDRKVSELK